jgi:predicted permease
MSLINWSWPSRKFSTPRRELAMRKILGRFWYAFRQRHFESELTEELEFHKAMKQRELEANGMTESAAANAAARAFGNATLAQEDARAVWIWPWLQHAWQDAVYAKRILVKSPGFTMIAVGVLALAIGANAAVFSILNGIFFKSLPGRAPERLVHITQVEDGRESEFSLVDYRYYRDASTTLSDIAVSSQVYMADGADAREVDGAVVSGNFFAVIGIEPFLGRFFLPSEDIAPGRDPIVVLGHQYWRQRFPDDVAVIGKTIELNGVVFTVVGVAPAPFRALRFGDPEVDVWIPTAMFDVARDAQRVGFTLVGRLSPGETVSSAQSEVSLLADRLATEAQSDKRRAVRLSHLTGAPTVSPELPRLLLIGVSCLLLIACANLAGLLISRGLNRRREMATRLALGATGWRLMRQTVTESMVLAVMGIVPGLLIAKVLVTSLAAYYVVEVEGVRPFFDFTLDATVVTYTIAIALCAGLLFGLVPGIQAARASYAAGLKAGAEGYRRSRMRSGLLVMQVALSVVLLVTAALMLQSLKTILASSGFESQRVAFIRMKTNLVKYPRDRALQYFQNVAARLETIPGVETVSFVQFPPVLDWSWGCGAPVYGGGDNVERPGDPLCSQQNAVTPAFFGTLGVEVLRGRVFQESDQSRDVAVVNEALARRFWPNRDPVGMSVLSNGREYRIIGLVRYLDYARADGITRPYWFIPAEQPGNRMLVRVATDPRAMLPTLRRAISEVDPAVPISEETALSDVVESMFTPVKLASTTLAYAGVLGLLLSGMGLYGVLAFSVSQRTREIGVRMALGARPLDVRRLVVQEGLVLVIVGLGLGMVAAVASARLLRAFLYGVNQTDWVSFLIGPIVLVAMAVLATYFPARRASRTSPIEALRCE